jgi:hypothetical protein
MLIGTNLIKSIDQGWLEVLGGQGVFITANQGIKINQTIQIKSFNFFIFTMLFITRIVLIYNS